MDPLKNGKLPKRYFARQVEENPALPYPPPQAFTLCTHYAGAESRRWWTGALGLH